MEDAMLTELGEAVVSAGGSGGSARADAVPTEAPATAPHHWLIFGQR
jgi:hypothetical protein